MLFQENMQFTVIQIYKEYNVGHIKKHTGTKKHTKYTLSSIFFANKLIIQNTLFPLNEIHPTLPPVEVNLFLIAPSVNFEPKLSAASSIKNIFYFLQIERI